MNKHWCRGFVLGGLMSVAGMAAAETRDVSYSKALMTGEQVYRSVCTACHATGAVGAPSVQDTQTWRKLAREGADELWGSAIAGLRRMPPMGGDPALQDIEVALAVNYMVGLAGARLPEPTAAAVKAARTGGERRARDRLREYRAARK